MPKRVMILLAVVSFGLAIAACNKGSSNPVVPTPGPTFSSTPDPKISSAIIQVTILGTPAAKIPVAESTPASKSSPQPGTIIVTLKTGQHGKIKFTHLKPSAAYCWYATIGKSGQMSGTCADWPIWQAGAVIKIGT